MNGFNNLELLSHFCFEYLHLPWVNSDAMRRKFVQSANSETVCWKFGASLDALDIFHAVRGKSVWLGNFETLSRKSGGADDEPTIRNFRIVGLKAAMGFKSDLSRWIHS